MIVNNIQQNINFGKTVRVNMPKKDVYSLVNLLNSNAGQKGQESLQKDAKTIFDDVHLGKAMAIESMDGRASYILTGEEANELNNVRIASIDALEMHN